VSTVAPKSVLGNILPSRDVAIRSTAPEIGLDVRPIGVKADSAGRSHTITVLLACVPTQRSSPRADEVAWAAHEGSSPIYFALGVLRPLLFV
jgi:hypothetical protein